MNREPSCCAMHMVYPQPPGPYRILRSKWLSLIFFNKKVDTLRLIYNVLYCLEWYVLLYDLLFSSVFKVTLKNMRMMLRNADVVNSCIHVKHVSFSCFIPNVINFNKLHVWRCESNVLIFFWFWRNSWHHRRWRYVSVFISSSTAHVEHGCTKFTSR